MHSQDVPTSSVVWFTKRMLYTSYPSERLSVNTALTIERSLLGSTSTIFLFVAHLIAFAMPSTK